MECELCGTEGPVRAYRIEGATVMACTQCGKFGTPVETPSTRKPSPYRAQSSPTTKSGPLLKPKGSFSGKKDENLSLMPGYGKEIENARKKLGLTRKELAESIFIRENMLARIESEKLRPKDDLVKKLERELEITLLKPMGEETSEVTNYQQKQTPSKKTLTLGDFAHIKKKK